MQFAGSLLFTLYFLTSIIVWSAVVALCFWLPYERRFALARAWARSIMWMARVCCGLTFEVEGQDNFPDEAVVILQKHSSAWETMAGFLYCPPHTWVIKRELMWIPVLGTALSVMRVIPINRKGRRSAVSQVIAKGSRRLRDGINIMIYPEGTRVAPGSNARFGRSGAMLATSAGAPVVPIAHNAGDYWGRQQLIKRGGCIKVVIGEPINTVGRAANEVNDEAVQWMDSTMARISEAFGDTPPLKPSS